MSWKNPGSLIYSMKKLPAREEYYHVGEIQKQKHTYELLKI